MKKYFNFTEHVRRYGFAIAFALIALVHFACQVPTQPTNITVNAPTTVVIQDQGNNPVSDPSVSVWWKVLRVDSNWTRMQSTNAQIPDGTFQAAIPIPVGDDTSRVAFMVNAPQGYTPAMQIDTEIGYCGAETFTYHITQAPIVVTTCDTTKRTSTSYLVANVPSNLSDTAQTRTFTNSYNTLTFSYSSTPPLPMGLTSLILQYSTNSGIKWAIFPPALPIPTGASYLFRFIYTANSNVTQNSSNQYVVTITGLDPNNNTCMKIVDTVNTQIKIQTPCDCPTGTFTYFDTASTCVGTPFNDTVSLKSITNANTQCSLVFSLASSSVLSPDVSISPDLSQTVIQPNTNVPGFLILTFNPKSAKTYDVEYDYIIARRAQGSTTTTPCDTLRIHLHGTVGTASCAIDPKSSILLNDTLKQVINSDSTSGIKELCVKNTGGCPVSITGATLVPNLGHPFHILTTLPVMVPPGGGCIEVSFNPTDSDVWPPSGIRGSNVKPIDTFRAALSITTSAGCDTTVPIIGVLTPPHYNNPCLQQWGTNNFYGGIVLDDSGTFTQPTESTSPNGFSIYASFVDPNGTSATLMSGGIMGGNESYVTFAKIDNNVNFALYDICQLNAINNYSGECGTINTMTSSIGNLTKGDVILFEYIDPITGKQECGLIWISDITSTSGSGISVCFQMCFPI